MSISLRERDGGKQLGEMKIIEALDKFRKENWPSSKEKDVVLPFNGQMPEGQDMWSRLQKTIKRSSSKEQVQAPARQSQGDKKPAFKPEARANGQPPKGQASKGKGGKGNYDENYFRQFPYCGGYELSADDKSLYEEVLSGANKVQGPNFARWKAHMDQLKMGDRV